jgi:hypothetical protein
MSYTGPGVNTDALHVHATGLREGRQGTQRCPRAPAAPAAHLKQAGKEDLVGDVVGVVLVPVNEVLVLQQQAGGACQAA